MLSNRAPAAVVPHPRLALPLSRQTRLWPTLGGGVLSHQHGHLLPGLSEEAMVRLKSAAKTTQEPPSCPRPKIVTAGLTSRNSKQSRGCSDAHRLFQRRPSPPLTGEMRIPHRNRRIGPARPLFSVTMRPANMECLGSHLPSLEPHPWSTESRSSTETAPSAAGRASSIPQKGGGWRGTIRAARQGDV